MFKGFFGKLLLLWIFSCGVGLAYIYAYDWAEKEGLNGKTTEEMIPVVEVPEDVLDPEHLFKMEWATVDRCQPGGRRDFEKVNLTVRFMWTNSLGQPVAYYVDTKHDMRLASCDDFYREVSRRNHCSAALDGAANNHLKCFVM